MEKEKTPFESFEDCDIYSVYEKEGEKFIHIDGFFFYRDASEDDYQYGIVEPCFMEYPLGEFIEKYNSQEEWYDIAWCEAKQYEGDIKTKDDVEKAFSEYGDGKEPIPMLLSALTPDTPCGVYYDSNPQK